MFFCNGQNECRAKNEQDRHHRDNKRLHQVSRVKLPFEYLYGLIAAGKMKQRKKVQSKSRCPYASPTELGDAPINISAQIKKSVESDNWLISIVASPRFGLPLIETGTKTKYHAMIFLRTHGLLPGQRCQWLQTRQVSRT